MVVFLLNCPVPRRERFGAPNGEPVPIQSPNHQHFYGWDGNHPQTPGLGVYVMNMYSLAIENGEFP